MRAGKYRRMREGLSLSLSFRRLTSLEFRNGIPIPSRVSYRRRRRRIRARGVNRGQYLHAEECGVADADEGNEGGSDDDLGIAGPFALGTIYK